MPITAKIVLEHTLEAALLDVNTDQRSIVPVIQHGKEIKGKLILSARHPLAHRCASARVSSHLALLHAQATKGTVQPFSELELSAGTRLLHKARLPRARAAAQVLLLSAWRASAD